MKIDLPSTADFIGYAIEGERGDLKAILVSKWCTSGDIIAYLRKHSEANKIQLMSVSFRSSDWDHSNPDVRSDPGHGDRVAISKSCHSSRRSETGRLPPYFHNLSDNCSISQHNVLVSDKDAAQQCDFRLSRIANELSKNKQSTVTLGFTTRYSSSEVLDKGMKMVKIDIYAFAWTCIHVSV